MFDLNSFLTASLREDIGWGDVTTDSCVPEDARSEGRFVAKENMVVCGLDVAEAVFMLLDPSIRFKRIVNDGDEIAPGGVIAEISGQSRAILTGERTALNLMQRLSGIATRTRAAVREIEGTGAVICDTRKTTPGLRALEKMAVRVGGGSNHRMGLSDGVLIKDNHIAAAGSITLAVGMARGKIPHTLKIEVETTTLDEVREALEAGADIIMLDNMTIDEMRAAVELIDGRALTEASGNMGDKSLREVASTGVNLISIGALTHTIRAADISLKFNVKRA